MTPLYDTLIHYAEKKPARFHMPGHKGEFLPLPELLNAAVLDVTELSETGNLYCAGEPFDTAQRLWAQRFGFEFCQFLTGGSTMGIHTGLAVLCTPGDRVLVDRNCHRSVLHAMALLDLEPVYLERPWLEEENLVGPVLPEAVETALNQHPKIKTVCITTPAYSGILSDTVAIAHKIHARGGKLLVDGAHGAHLPFLGLEPFLGADVVVVSAHKTLPALGQAALLFTNRIDPEQVRRMASVFGTSSPSYLILASLDAVRAWMEEEGTRAYRLAVLETEEIRTKFPALQGGQGYRWSLDPARLTLKGKDGPAFARRLEERGIVPEMEDGGHVVLITTPQDLKGNFHRLKTALEALRGDMGSCPPIPAPPRPERACSPRAALFGSSLIRPLEDCEGKIAADSIAPYPPGVPVVAPGERIGKKELAYLRKIGYNTRSEVRIAADPQMSEGSYGTIGLGG